MSSNDIVLFVDLGGLELEDIDFNIDDKGHGLLHLAVMTGS